MRGAKTLRQGPAGPGVAKRSCVPKFSPVHSSPLTGLDSDQRGEERQGLNKGRDDSRGAPVRGARGADFAPVGAGRWSPASACANRSGALGSRGLALSISARPGHRVTTAAGAPRRHSRFPQRADAKPPANRAALLVVGPAPAGRGGE